MPILDTDIRFRKSLRMTDFPDGGGAMSSAVVVDGVDNNVFDDIPDTDRLFGAVSLRKIYAAALNNDADVYLGAHVMLDDAPDDAATSAVLFRGAGVTSVRSDVVGTLAAGYSLLGIGPGGVPTLSATFAGGATSFQPNPIVPIPVGSVLSLNVAGVRHLRKVVSIIFEDTPDTLNLDAALPGSGTVSCTVQCLVLSDTHSHFGVAIAASGASGGSATVDSVWARVAPVVLDTAYPTTGPYVSQAPTHGQVPIFGPGDGVLVHSTVAMSPSSVSNGQTVDATRINLSRLRVIGSDGTEHARFVAGQPAPTGVGCTADLAAGTVSFTNVSGYNQPVTIEHRIEELVGVSSVGYGSGVVTFNRNLSRTYPAGTKVSSLLFVGDLQGRVTNVAFTQLAWNGSWSNSRVGLEPPGDYNLATNPILCTNKGAVTERWYIEFLTATTFRCIGEQFGVVGTGSTGANFAPNNPATSTPYFTVQAGGWGGGWAAGNVFRFNTDGANVPVWVARVVAPSTPGGNDSVTVQMRGYVNT